VLCIVFASVHGLTQQGPQGRRGSPTIGVDGVANEGTRPFATLATDEAKQLSESYEISQSFVHKVVISVNGNEIKTAVVIPK
jgi:hypothetical protein